MIERNEEETACLAAVRRGESSACSELFEAYRPLTESMVSSIIGKVNADVQEVRSEAEFALYRSALSFDQNQETMTFGLYAKICMRNHLTSRFLRRKPAPTALSLEELERLTDYEDLLADEVDVVEGEESLLALHGKIREVLSTYELTVFHLWLEDYSAREIATRLGKDEKSVTNAVSRSLAKLRSALQ